MWIWTGQKYEIIFNKNLKKLNGGNKKSVAVTLMKRNPFDDNPRKLYMHYGFKKLDEVTFD